LVAALKFHLKTANSETIPPFAVSNAAEPDDKQLPVMLA
jgi:hypothetical protein